MLKFVSGDLFEYDATVRINTVNCVGVMGKGVALAFKKRYPAMFKDYKHACEDGDVQPGRLHIWTSDDGTTVVNFPTKRHWRQNSRIEDVEDGLKALHEFLIKQGDVRVTLPALGCGHGGLDWEKVSNLIRQYLSDVPAEVLVFAPSASKNADEALQNGVDEATKEELIKAGIVTLATHDQSLPTSLSALGVNRVYVKGDSLGLNEARVACLCSTSPTDREIVAATLCVEELAAAGIPIVCGFGAKIERRLIATVLEHRGRVIISLPSGILDFKIPKGLQSVWDDQRITIVSTCGPRQRWTLGAAKEASRTSLAISKLVLITDSKPRQWKSLVSQVRKEHSLAVSYVDYQQNGPDVTAMQSVAAMPIRRNKETGRPSMDHIIEKIAGPRIVRELVMQGPSVHSDTFSIDNREPEADSMPESRSIKGDSGGRQYPKRLIEVDLPIARISAHARREKTIRHGHISTLHIWWARRPLAACRAVICASLWPDPADELCPQHFRDVAVDQIKEFSLRVFPHKITEEGRTLTSEKHSSHESRARWEAIARGTLTLNSNEPTDMPILRLCLLDFIADFASWDNSNVDAFLDVSRNLTQVAHVSLGGIPGTRPLVLDPFSGGGSIPLEALRVGADSFASDLNPVAVLLNRVLMEFVPKYGEELGKEVQRMGAWITQQARSELCAYFPEDEGGELPIAYLWARCILSDSPGSSGYPVEIPLLKTMWLAKKGNTRFAMRWVRDSNGKVRTEEVDAEYADGSVKRVQRPLLEVFEPKSDKEVEGGTVARGSATCPVTGFTTRVDSVRSQLRSRRGGAADSRLFCVVTTRLKQKGRKYRLATDADFAAIRAAQARLAELTSSSLTDEIPSIPNEPTPMGGGKGAGRAFSQRNYGMELFSDLFTPRQLLSLVTLTRLVREAGERLRESSNDEGFADAVQACLALCLGRVADLANSLCGWTLDTQCPKHLFARQAIPIVWSFAEGVCISDSSGSWSVVAERFPDSIASTVFGVSPGTAEQVSAIKHTLPDDSAAALLTDPPYYDAVPYADLSDFFYVWLKRSLPDSQSRPFNSQLTPKEDECIVDDAKAKDSQYFERTMTMAMSEGRRVLTPNGIGMVVFANKTTEGWEAMLQSMIEAGWTITASWPVDTEMGSRLRARDSAALASSVHLVCRPREDDSGNVTEAIGEWRDVLSELPRRIHEWMPRLAAEGVVGADAIFACLGPALEIYSRYSRVEKSNGETATLREYLEFVWGAVSTEALSLIFRDADASGLEPDARLTAMWLWTIGGGLDGNWTSEKSEVEDPKSKPSEGFTLEFDAARKIAQGLGVHLEQCESLVEISGDKAKLLPVNARTRHLFGKAATTSNRSKPKKVKQRTLFEELDEVEASEDGWTTLKGPPPGTTTLDRVHQAMILFAANRGELLKRFLVEDGVGKDERFWKLADNLNKLYPAGTEERRWVEGVLARKKGLGL